MSDTGPQSLPDPDHLTIDQPRELELSDADILDAMREIPGYLDITTADFRIIYHLAHAHAVERMNSRLSADKLMRSPIQPLDPTTRLIDAAGALLRQSLKALPVTDQDGRVIGILTETDLLKCLGARSFLELLPRLLSQGERFAECAPYTPTGTIMTAPAVTVREQAGFTQIMAAFRRHAGRSMPVVDDRDRLVGLLMRKDFLSAWQLGV
jgi:CBS-domain-containing membrane protein